MSTHRNDRAAIMEGGAAIDASAYGAAVSLQERLDVRLAAAPDARALAFLDARGGYRWLSFGEVHARASSRANALVARGLRPGDVCVLILASGEPSASLVLAVLLAGGVPLLIAPPVIQNPHSQLAEIARRVVRKTKARMLVAPGVASVIDAFSGRSSPVVVDDLEELSHGTGSLEVIRPAGHDVAALQLTSGTTGFPRVCAWTHRGVLAALDGMARAMALDEHDVCFNWTPLYHDMGLVNNFLLCLIHGVPLALLSPTDFIKRPALWLRGLADTGATVTWSPNFGFAVASERVKDDEIAGVRLEGVRAFWNAAERIHLETIRTFQQRFAAWGVRADALKTNYGCAENVGGATFSSPHGDFVVEQVDEVALRRDRQARVVQPGHDSGPVMSVVGAGRPYPGLRIAILSEKGKRLPDGQVGEIALDTPSRMIGYLSDAAATRRAVLDTLLRTGDLGYLRAGELFWVGRVRERITIRGRKIDPSDFERVLGDIAGLRRGCFAAFGVDDPHAGTERLVIVTETRETSAESLQCLVSVIQGKVLLEQGLTVDRVLLVPTGVLTKTSSGKRRHRHFRQLYIEGRLHGLEIAKGA